MQIVKSVLVLTFLLAITVCCQGQSPSPSSPTVSTTITAPPLTSAPTISTTTSWQPAVTVPCSNTELQDKVRDGILAVHPLNARYKACRTRGKDGGLAITTDGGITWRMQPIPLPSGCNTAEGRCLDMDTAGVIRVVLKAYKQQHGQGIYVWSVRVTGESIGLTQVDLAGATIGVYQPYVKCDPRQGPYQDNFYVTWMRATPDEENAVLKQASMHFSAYDKSGKRWAHRVLAEGFLDLHPEFVHLEMNPDLVVVKWLEFVLNKDGSGTGHGKEECLRLSEL